MSDILSFMCRAASAMAARAAMCEGVCEGVCGVCVVCVGGSHSLCGGDTFRVIYVRIVVRKVLQVICTI